MSYTDTVAQLAEATEDALVKALDDWSTGRIHFIDLDARLTAIMAQARAAAVMLADVSLATELTRLWGRYVAPLGLVLLGSPEGDAAVLAGALLSDERIETNAAALAGIAARSVVNGTAQSAYQEGMRAHGVRTWTRETNGGACEICSALADGADIPAGTDMWSHKGCGCTPRPTE